VFWYCTSIYTEVRVELYDVISQCSILSLVYHPGCVNCTRNVFLFEVKEKCNVMSNRYDSLDESYDDNIFS